MPPKKKPVKKKPVKKKATKVKKTKGKVKKEAKVKKKTTTKTKVMKNVGKVNKQMPDILKVLGTISADNTKDMSYLKNLIRSDTVKASINDNQKIKMTDTGVKELGKNIDNYIKSIDMKGNDYFDKVFNNNQNKVILFDNQLMDIKKNNMSAYDGLSKLQYNSVTKDLVGTKPFKMNTIFGTTLI